MFFLITVLKSLSRTFFIFFSYFSIYVIIFSFFLCSYGETLFFSFFFYFSDEKSFLAKHGRDLNTVKYHWELNGIFCVYYFLVRLFWGENIILSLLYTASYSNHYRHHFNKFWVLAQAHQCIFSICSWMLLAHETHNFFFCFQCEKWEKKAIFTVFSFFCDFFIQQWYKQTNYIAKVFGSLKERKNFFCLFSLLFHFFHTCYCKQMCTELDEKT